LASIDDVTELRTLALRPWLAAILVLVLSVAGVGRGWAATPDAFEAAPIIAGGAVPICHADANGSSGTDAPGHHDCCDTCALCGPVMLPGTPDVSAPASVVHYIAHTAALSWSPILARPHTPRLSQGPPAA
jgi:hypothetical protein